MVKDELDFVYVCQTYLRDVLGSWCEGYIVLSPTKTISWLTHLVICQTDIRRLYLGSRPQNEGVRIHGEPQPNRRNMFNMGCESFV
jgi:hypothetical protein